jgi:LPXTG-site transpeptidase (sortase) family protein
VAGPSEAPKPSEASKPPKPSDPALPRSAPTRLLIPQIGVDAPFTDLAIGPSGALDAPPQDDVNLVGWFAAGVSPGEHGTSIIAGHVDTVTSPAVFAELSELKAGHRFHVRRKDGTTATFVVDAVESFHKDTFPNERVYADTPDAQVRLITCSGRYDRKAKDYTENLVVFAHLDAPK